MSKTDEAPAFTQPQAWDRVAEGYADFISDFLGLFATDALRLAGVKAGDRVADIATGPGTLARLAADITTVHALDFSPEMIEALRARATPQQLDRLTLVVGNGMALPFPDASFDVAFSMFGLFMFPDRSRGFAELARVLVPGGRAVVGSWQSFADVPAFQIVGEEIMRATGQDGEHAGGGPPLSAPEAFEAEMRAAGFEVELHSVSHASQTSSTAEMWAGLSKADVSIGIARDELPADAFEAMLARIEKRLHTELGDGPQSMEMRAWLGVGRLPA